MNRTRHLIVIGAAAGGMVLAALGDLAAAPTAAADSDITDIIAAVDATDAIGQSWFGDAATALSTGDLGDGLADGFTGFDDDVFGAQHDLLQYGYEALQGIDGPYSAHDYAPLPVPTDLATTSTDVAEYVEYARDSLSSASFDFGSGNVAAGLGDLVDATDEYIAASQIELIGLTDVLTTPSL
jgi:hypothetical protein